MNSIASEFKKHRLYSSFLEVKKRLQAHQFVCWVAGGAVRDLLLGREVSDFDLVTDASIEVLKTLFPEALLVGESFGVLKIPIEGGDFFDLATFREESDYLDGRRPSKVSSSTPTMDSARRDFTINSMYWDDENATLQDYCGGMEDLQNSLLKCVGAPEIRFEEDKLRILRLLRFSAQLGFRMHRMTQGAAINKVSQIDRVSGERIAAELRKIEISLNLPKVLDEALFSALLNQIFGISKAELMKHRASLSTVTDFKMLLIVVKSENDFSEILKDRLKCSNVDLKRYRNLRKIYQKKATFSLEEIAFELESSADFEVCMLDLIRSGFFKAEVLTSAYDLLKNTGPSLVQATDLMSKVPKASLGLELREIRLKQLGKIFRTKEDVVRYLEKKYAK